MSSATQACLRSDRPPPHASPRHSIKFNRHFKHNLLKSSVVLGWFLYWKLGGDWRTKTDFVGTRLDCLLLFFPWSTLISIINLQLAMALVDRQPSSDSSSAVTLKLSHNSLLRRIAAPAQWTDLVARVKALFTLPDGVTIAATYVDDDGDRITIDTDVEYRDLVAQAAREAKPLRLDVLVGGSQAANDAYVLVEQAVREGVEKMVCALLLSCVFFENRSLGKSPRRTSLSTRRPRKRPRNHPSPCRKNTPPRPSHPARRRRRPTTTLTQSSWLLCNLWLTSSSLPWTRHRANTSLGCSATSRECSRHATGASPSKAKTGCRSSLSWTVKTLRATRSRSGTASSATTA